jgi:hypothetical protein
MRTYWVDGHCISAGTEREARAEVARLYGYEPEEVRPWTAEDDLWSEPDDDDAFISVEDDEDEEVLA